MSADTSVKVMVVEDSKITRKMEIKILKQLGFNNIVVADDGEDAIQKLREQDDIRLIISDWNMPNKGGYELLVWMRAHEKFEKLPFIMATGEGDMKQEKKAVDAGVSGFIAKPFNADELKKKIDQAFGMGEKEEETPEEERTPKKTVSGKVRLKIAHIQITDHLILGALKHLIKNGDLAPRHFELETLFMPGWR